MVASAGGVVLYVTITPKHTGSRTFTPTEDIGGEWGRELGAGATTDTLEK
jgi:hypothetical protein